MEAVHHLLRSKVPHQTPSLRAHGKTAVTLPFKDGHRQERELPALGSTAFDTFQEVAHCSFP